MFAYIVYATAQFWRAVLYGVATGLYSISGVFESIAHNTAVKIDERTLKNRAKSPEPAVTYSSDTELN